MDKKTRVLNCIDNKPIDRISFCSLEKTVGTLRENHISLFKSP